MADSIPDAGPVRLALIGAGTFARKAHVPSLLNLQDRVQVVAVCSRSHESAATVAAMLAKNESGDGPEIYDHIPTLLAQKQIDAVDVVLPIPAMPEVVEMALAAGKHVVSEKPIAPTVARAQAMLAVYEQHRQQIWMVAENFRYEEAYQAAGAAIAAGEIGKPLFCHWALHLPVEPGAPYHRTEWRRSNQFPGGFLLDGGVHHVAALRSVLGEIETVTAITAAHRGDLPPADTLSATLRFASGVVGSYAVTYAAGELPGTDLCVVGETGALRVSAEALTIVRGQEQQTQTFPRHLSVERELAAFVEAIRSRASYRNTPQEGVRDLAVVEALLRTAESGQCQRVE